VKKIRIISTAALIIVSLLSLLYVGVTSAVPDKVSVFSDEVNYSGLSSYPTLTVTGKNTACVEFLGIRLKQVELNVYERTKLVPGGMPFGIKFFTDGLIVVGVAAVNTASGVKSPGKDSGVEQGDIIEFINGEKIVDANSFSLKVAASGGTAVTLRGIRDGESFEVKLTPVLSSDDGVYRLGIWVRDSTAGIGTVTFIDKKTGVFGGLGHGINDRDSGVLLPLGSALVVDVAIYDVEKGRPNAPGELRGRFSSVRRGVLSSNTSHGVFGIMLNATEAGEELPIGLRGEVHTGKAYICSTVDGEGVKQYEIKIIKISENDSEGKNLSLKVTDPELLEATGGIVQSMSGSPIIQDGKLIGAVTHVLVSDPTKGYGIFIEEMLKSANG